MGSNHRLMEMLTGYAAAHQNPFNIFVHMIGIPTIMFGVLIPLTWLQLDVLGVAVSLAHVVMLDTLFAIVFVVFALIIAQFATWVGERPIAVSGSIAAAAFFGGYALQFIGHAVEKSMPVLVKHPIQANLAAPFFTVVEMFKILRLRDDLFTEVQNRIAVQRNQEASSS